jgi:nitrogen fixation/metabolism regulation signal transduction histidine kinase
MRAFDTMVAEIERNKELNAKIEREQAWREMAKQVAHEIKNPLTPMKLSVQQLQRSFEDRARDREETLQTVARTLLEQIEALARIATEFSHFARLPHRRLEKFDLVQLIRDTSTLYASIPGIALTVRLPDQKSVIVGDEDEVRRVCVNLLRNAVQALDGRGTIRIDGFVEEGNLVVDVTDSGPGVPDHVGDRIFEPNFSTKTEGMGLGLAISRRIVEDLGGTLTLERTGSGASFRLRVPLTT